ncbi:MAG: hypothetical protein LC624_07940, partial [Halobacteriales archaeon]|nr:hypothetical protein [Halobacteriales archaeon]
YNGDGTLWRTLLAPPTGDSQEPLGFPAVANGAWGDLDGDGGKDYALGLLGARALPRFLVSGPRLDWQHELAAWDPVLNVSKPGFPKVIEDWMFFVQPAIGDVDNDAATQEVITGSGGYLLHAWDHAGLEALDQPPGTELSSWPKYIGGWMTASPAVGKLDASGHNLVTVGTREGLLFVWDTAGVGGTDWPMFKRDAARDSLET